MNLPDRCPFCGAGQSSFGFDGRYFKAYGCGTTISHHQNPERMRSRDCRIAERDGLKTRVAELEARCKRLEEIGDMIVDEYMVVEPEKSAWQQAKEAKP